MGLKRIAERSREKLRKKRKIYPTIVVVCEGKDTESNYFDNFKLKYTRIDVQIADKSSRGKNKGRATDPESLVKKAINIKNSKFDIEEADGDRVWCVFDVDVDFNNPDPINSKINQIEKAKRLADKNNIRLGISNPCFELWYLLHFEYTTSNLKNYEDVKKRLERYIPDYGKNKNVYDGLEEHLEKAIKLCNKLKNHHKSLGKDLPDSESDYCKMKVKDIVNSNPYTNIIDLIRYMEYLEKGSQG